MGQAIPCSACQCDKDNVAQKDSSSGVRSQHMQEEDDGIMVYARDELKDEREEETALPPSSNPSVIDFAKLEKKEESQATAYQPSYQPQENTQPAEQSVAEDLEATGGFQELQVIPEQSHERNPDNALSEKVGPPVGVAEESWPAKVAEPIPAKISLTSEQDRKSSGRGSDRGSGFKKLHQASQAGIESGEGIQDHIGAPSLWEGFVGAEYPSQCPFCGFICIVSVVLLLVVGGVMSIKMSDSFGFFVLSDDITQAFFVHENFLKDRPYFTEVDTAAFVDFPVKKRAQPVALATIFLEVKGTKCPGDDCNLKSKNAISAKYLNYIRQVESKIWNNEIFKSKYCGLLSPPADRCYPPKSPLSLLLWDDTTSADASKALANEGFVSGNLATCQSWQSPLDNVPGVCSSPAWTHVFDNSGAAAPGDLESYGSVIDRMCTKNNNYWASLRESWLPNFACQDDHMKKHGVPFLRSQLLFGIPYDKDRKASDIDLMDQIDDLADEYGTDFFKLTTDVVKDVLDGDEDVNIIVSSPVSAAAERNAMQMATLSFTAASFLFVFLYMWFNVESFFLASFGMLQVLFSVFPTAIVWSFIDQQGIQFLQFLAVFMILGIGADDTFVLNDAWKQAKHELQDVAHDMSTIHVFTLAYRRSFSAMMATTMTTAWAFFFGILNPIPAIADFCVFACIIVLFDFLLCISMFAACVAFHEKYMVGKMCCCFGGTPAPGTCCAPGCCWGLTRMIWRKCHKIPADKTTDQRNLELFFSGPLFRCLKRFKYPLICFWVLLFVGAAISMVLGVKVATKDPEGLPADHPLQRFDTISSEYFTQESPTKVRVLWGIADEGPVLEWSKTESQKPTKIDFTGVSAAVSKEGQQKILNLCKAPTLEAGTRRCFGKSCLVKGSPTACQVNSENGMSYFDDPLCQNGRYCIMEQVHDYAAKNGLSWPLDDFHGVVSSADFSNYMRDWFAFLGTKKQHWHAENYKDDTGIVIEGSKVKYMWISFNATFEGAFLPPKDGNKIYDDWQDFVKSHVDGTNFHQVNLMYLFKVLQDILVRECFKSIFAALMVAFITICLVTWNWLLAFLGLFNIMAIVAYFMGLWPILGWELDIYNVIFSIMAVGLSVDYTVHILHAYNESHEIEREGRVQTALASMGITVISGAITTLLAAFPLLFTVPTFFNRFGSFVFITIFFSIVATLLLLVPLLLVVGPNGHQEQDSETVLCCRFGEIRCFYGLRARWRRFRKKPTDSE